MTKTVNHEEKPLSERPPRQFASRDDGRALSALRSGVLPGNPVLGMDDDLPDRSTVGHLSPARWDTLGTLRLSWPQSVRHPDAQNPLRCRSERVSICRGHLGWLEGAVKRWVPFGGQFRELSIERHHAQIFETDTDTAAASARSRLGGRHRRPAGGVSVTCPQGQKWVP